MEVPKLNKIFLSLLILMLITSVLPTTLSETSEPTLAETMNISLNKVDWSIANSWTIIWGQIFSQNNAAHFDTAITSAIANRNYLEALFISRLADLNNYSSPIVYRATQTASQNFPMAGSLPLTAVDTKKYGDPNVLNDGAFLLYDRFLVWSYLKAENKTKWNITQAYLDFSDLYEKNGEMLWVDPQEDWAKSYASRYYDEHAETLSMFLKFAQAGIPEAMLYADKEWENLQKHWKGEYYSYWNSGNVECEMGNFAQIIAEYKEARGEIPYWDRVIQDLNYKLLVKGWNSPGWSVAGVVKHAEGNPQQRLRETLGVITTLHQLHPYFTDTMKLSFKTMLLGLNVSIPAWQGLLSSELYSDGYFRISNDSDISNDATIVGLALMFLEGIVPDTGSLGFIPREERYGDYRTTFPISQFKFDIAQKLLRLPIKAGNLSFAYGLEIVNHEFSKDGVYNIWFSDDWNSIIEAQKISALDAAVTISVPATIAPRVKTDDSTEILPVDNSAVETPNPSPTYPLENKTKGKTPVHKPNATSPTQFELAEVKTIVEGVGIFCCLFVLVLQKRLKRKYLEEE